VRRGYVNLRQVSLVRTVQSMIGHIWSGYVTLVHVSPG
jgi:hypothetical protein